MIFKRVKLIRYLFIFIFIMFLVVDSWLFYKLIIYNYKKIVVNFNDVKDIKYIPYMGPSGKYNIFGIGWRTTGQIVIYLHNNKKIYVSDIKKVSTACVDLRKIVLDIAD